MNTQEQRDYAYLTVVGQSALLVLSGLFLLSASVLFGAVMLADTSPSAQVVALLNAAMFYLFGMAIYTTIIKKWKAGQRAWETRVKSDSSSREF